MCYITVGSGAAVHADIDDDDEDDDHNDMGYYNSDRSPVSVGAATPSSGKKGGRGGSGGHVADPEERLQRSRERNRMHARKTRQRKKLQMQTLQVRAEELKLEQVRGGRGAKAASVASCLVLLLLCQDKLTPFSRHFTPRPTASPQANHQRPKNRQHFARDHLRFLSDLLALLVSFPPAPRCV